MVAAQAGDRAAYETLLRDCIPFIKRVARGQGVQPDFIDDVVQETLLTVHGARHTYDPNSVIHSLAQNNCAAARDRRTAPRWSDGCPRNLRASRL